MQRCRQLFEDLKEYGPNHEKVKGKRTKKGENRLKSCVKYDLGGGYRLVTVMNGDDLFITFFGSHDETDTWFDRHKADDFTRDNPVYSCEQFKFLVRDESSEDCIGDQVEVDAYEAELEARLDENMLLSIFKGLQGQNNNNHLECEA